MRRLSSSRTPRVKRGLILSLDLVGIDRGFAGRVTDALTKQYQIPRESVAICTSHTHSGPVVAGNLAPLHYERLEPAQQKALDAYADELLAKITAMAGEAVGKLAPARCSGAPANALSR